MAIEEKQIRYRISDIARELQVSPQEVLQFVKQEGGKVASTSSMVGEEMRDMIFGNFSQEKKLVDETRKIRAEKQKRLTRLEEQSRKAYEKEQQLKESLSSTPPPSPAVAHVPELKFEIPPEAAKPVAVEPPPAPPVAVAPPQPEPVVEQPSAAKPVTEPVAKEPAPVAPPVEPVVEVKPVVAEPAPEPEPVAVVKEPEAITLLVQTLPESMLTYEAPQKIGGLTVLGTIDVISEADRKKKSRKKNFRENAVELKGEFENAVSPSTEGGEAAKKKAAKAPGEASTTTAAGEESAAAKKKKGKKKKKVEVDDKVISKNIKSTISGMEDSGSSGSRQKFRKMRRMEREREYEEAEAMREAEKTLMRVTEYASPHELAELMGLTAKEIIQKCFSMGKFVTINQRLDKETIELIGLEFGFEAEFISEIEATSIEERIDNEEDMQIRPPVVTIMGHVDHGKTSLLDYIRRSNVVAGESGGITQHIGAYEVEVEKGRHITFLDTPGHEAFTAMRARGAQVTDIVILVVAADDSVMPQTIEAINHSKAAGVPIVVALNKIDKPEANVEKIKTQLSEAGVMVEDWGGECQCQEISAKKGLNIKELMDKVLTEAEIRELKGNFSREVPASGIIVESELDKGKGVVSTVLVQRGFLKVGDPFVAGNTMGKVRALMDERGKRIPEAGPSRPVRVLGFEDLPQSGDALTVMLSDREARDVAQKRQVIRREHEFRRSTRVKLDSIARQIKEGLKKELSVIIKADTDGSIQALADGLMKIHNEEVKVQIIHQGVGQITETDVLLAAASDAIIIGFRVRPNVNAKRLAEKEDLDVRFYSVIYHVLEDVEKALEGMLSPELHEESLGSIEIRQVFRVPKVGNVGGAYVLEGKVPRDSKVRLLRDGVQIFEGQLDSLKRFKDDVKEVDAGYECGVSLKGYDDIKVGDVVEAFKIVEKKRKL
ncbi:translation initiation factor IF-2 [Chlorobaculum thiosulfatiphilum]|uniref:Translation initiation factor IF-2 n=1 Tax=Chlorobaculum thiosulfatiphilum TaxID=115852 RepID=A0A5C4S817_CHLTI|nr:translation initiation factor IF-2 [Chlorobaculum thiosulfatiphilum]TNJ39089.1 translation initiation factor IF-2 [Chlorobaculum thiosulfatiphilum]